MSLLCENVTGVSDVQRFSAECKENMNSETGEKVGGVGWGWGGGWGRVVKPLHACHVMRINYRRRLRSLLLYLCHVFRALINPHVLCIRLQIILTLLPVLLSDVKFALTVR